MPHSTPIVPVILSGGSGTRLWPMSRPERPKQLLALTAEATMLQLTAQRTPHGERFARPVVVAITSPSELAATLLVTTANRTSGLIPLIVLVVPTLCHG